MATNPLTRLQQIRAERQDAQLAMRRLLQRLEELDSEEDQLWGQGIQITPDFVRPLREGDRVVVSCKDQYYRRTGTLRFLSSGGQRWNIQLDPTGTQAGPLIQKAESNLLLLASSADGGTGKDQKTTASEKDRKTPDPPPRSKSKW